MSENVENRACGCMMQQNNNINDNNVIMNNNEIKDCNCFNSIKEEMMSKIMSLDFAIVELALYLDTHPEDQRALCLHRAYCKEVKELKDRYQKVYGPLTINYPCNKWRWIEEPWPWERGNY